MIQNTINNSYITIFYKRRKFVHKSLIIWKKKILGHSIIFLINFFTLVNLIILWKLNSIWKIQPQFESPLHCFVQCSCNHLNIVVDRSSLTIWFLNYIELVSTHPWNVKVAFTELFKDLLFGKQVGKIWDNWNVQITEHDLK